MITYIHDRDVYEFLQLNRGIIYITGCAIRGMTALELIAFLQARQG